MAVSSFIFTIVAGRCHRMVAVPVMSPKGEGAKLCPWRRQDCTPRLPHLVQIRQIIISLRTMMVLFRGTYSRLQFLQNLRRSRSPCGICTVRVLGTCCLSGVCIIRSIS